MNSKPRMTRRQLAAHLRELGYPISDSVMNKLCAPAVGEGPPVAVWWGNRPLYDVDAGIAWAEARTRPVRQGDAPGVRRVAAAEAGAS
jgi:hypothetical protein